MMLDERMMADQTTPDNEDTAKKAETPAPEAAAPAPDNSEALQAEVTEMKNKVLRTLAEMENLRRRTEREMADARTYAVASFARDMLTVGDNLRRAIDAVPKEQRDGRDPALNALIEGVEVTERGMEQAMQKFGVRRVETKGAKFDPSMHQAMYEADSPDAAPGTVVEEIQAGYAIGDRVLRPALVAIAKPWLPRTTPSPRSPPRPKVRKASGPAFRLAGGQFRQSPPERIWRHRLFQNRVDAGGLRRGAGLGQHVGGNRQDGGAREAESRLPFADGAGRRQSVEPGHMQIHQDDGEAAGLAAGG